MRNELDRPNSLSDVSRETLARLEQFSDLLTKWNVKINLVSPNTVAQLWERHIVDSAQIYPFLEREAGVAADLGTGGGFPGAILSILLKEKNPEMRYVFVESDKRKAAFLQTIIGTFSLNAEVKVERIEAADPLAAGIVTARALAPLSKLLGYTYRHLATDGTAFLLKGKSVGDELEEALASWSFEMNTYQSETTPNGVILRISHLRPA